MKKIEQKLAKIEHLIPYVLIIVLLWEIGLTSEQLELSNSKLLTSIYTFILPIKSATWFLLYNVILFSFTFYSFVFGEKHNKIFVIITWISTLLTYLFNVSSNLGNPFWYYFYIFYFPLFLISLSTFEVYFKRNKDIVKKQSKHLIIPVIYVAFNFIFALITNTNLSTYQSVKFDGNSGWFSSGNSIGHVITIVFPIIIYYLYKNIKSIWLWLAFLAAVYIQLTIGTKTPFFGMVLASSIFVLTLFVANLSNKKALAIGLGSSIVFVTSVIYIFNVTPIKNNLEVVGFDNTERFFAVRNRLLVNERDNFFSMDDGEINTKKLLFGEIYPEKKLVEKDYYDILFNSGFFGLTVFVYILSYYLISGFISIFKNFKKENFIKIAMYLTSIFLILGIAMYSGHVFRGSYVVLFVAYIIALFSRIFGDNNE